MKKEVLLAIIIGITLGLIIMAGVKFNSLKSFITGNEKQTTIADAVSPAPTSTITPTPESDLTISILSPENESIIETSSVELTGKTSPLSTVVIIAEEDEIILQSGAQGEFETSVDLIGGENIIEITAYDSKGSEVKTDLTLTYTTADI
jgi:hypothetical protein